MPKVVMDAALDAALAWECDADVLRVCSTLDATPTHAEVVAATLASVAMTPGSGNGDFLIADGDVSGRKLTVLAQNGISVSTGGSANHIALTKTGDTTVRLVTTCTAQTLVGGNTVNVPAYKHEIADPT